MLPAASYDKIENTVKDRRGGWGYGAGFGRRKLKNMGDESNRFHREVVRPGVSLLLDIKPQDYILDIACGNGNFSAFMAEQGARVEAFDYSPRMIELAKRRQEKYLHKIHFSVIDATRQAELMSLEGEQKFTKAMLLSPLLDRNIRHLLPKRICD